MASPFGKVGVLSFDPLVLARCYYVADILERCYDQKSMEYGALGVAMRSRPWHVVAAPLLPGQRVTDDSVYQSGHDVLQMRREVAALAKRFRQELVPVCMIHRHPGPCQPSETDFRFASEVFINQVAATMMFRAAGSAHCGCGDHASAPSVPVSSGERNPAAMRPAESAYALCFSLIVNARREHALFAVCKQWCPCCDSAETTILPAELRVRPTRRLNARTRLRLWDGLKSEIRAKIHFDETPIGGRTTTSDGD